jgi:hydroxypyruvate isomerase
MPTFAANLTMLWNELDPYERFAAAARHGFRHVEMLFPHELDASRLERTLREHQQELVLFDPAPGNWASGERGLLCLPGREDEFRRSVDDAITLATRLGSRRLNALAGIVPHGTSRLMATEVAIANLRWAAPRVEQAGLTLLVESINAIDMPGYLAATAEEAVHLVNATDSPAVRLQLDQYHVAMAGDDAIDTFRRYAPLVAHVQIADVPGRHQPGTGEQPIDAFLEELDRIGYAGYVGLEYRPLGSTEESLAWLETRRDPSPLRGA